MDARRNDIGGAADGRIGPPGRWPSFSDPRFRLFLRHWAERRVGLVVPRSAIDPATLKPCLPYVYLMRYDPAFDTFICTLSGELVNQAWGTTLMGKRPHDFMPASSAALANEIYRRIVLTPILHVGHRHSGSPDVPVKAAERLVVPLSDADGRPYGLFGLSVYHFDPIAEATYAPHVGSNFTEYFCADLPADLPPE
jgi:hypothetical protein